MTDGRDALHLIVGPHDHGVVRFGLDLAALAGHQVAHLPARDDVLPPGALTCARAVHLQYTDALYGPDTASAAATFAHLCDRLRELTPARLSVTLHDLPDPADEPGRYRRRSGAYRRVVGVVDAVMVSSEHERSLLATFTDPSRVTVIPLPIPAPALTRPADRPEPRPEVGVFGFIHPGKGHLDVLAAMSDLPTDLGLTALGRTADHHDELAGELAAEAGRHGRTLTISGFVPDDDLVARLRRVAVPVAPARMVSASGSINTWIAAGRRPLVARNGYSDELARRYPGAIHRYRPGELPAMLRRMLADPDLTWLRDPPPGDLGEAAVGRAYRAALSFGPGRRTEVGVRAG